MTVLAATLNERISTQGRHKPIGKAQDQVKKVSTSQAAPSLADMDDMDLMDRVIANDQLAYREIVKRYFEKMYALAYRMVQQGADAEDIAQDVFFKLWTNRENWQREGAQISTWLYRVTLNRSIDFKRRPVGENLDTAPEVEDRSPSAVTLIQRSQTSRLLKEATSKLSEQQQAALALFYQQELSNAEAAQVLGVKVNAMESLLKRARQKLREILKHSSGEMLETMRE